MSLFDNPDEYYMQQALREARAAFDEDEIPVGAVIVGNERIIARAHNNRFRTPWTWNVAPEDKGGKRRVESGVRNLAERVFHKEKTIDFSSHPSQHKDHERFFIKEHLHNPEPH